MVGNDGGDIEFQVLVGELAEALVVSEEDVVEAIGSDEVPYRDIGEDDMPFCLSTGAWHFSNRASCLVYRKYPKCALAGLSGGRERRRQMSGLKS